MLTGSAGDVVRRFLEYNLQVAGRAVERGGPEYATLAAICRDGERSPIRPDSARAALELVRAIRPTAALPAISLVASDTSEIVAYVYAFEAPHWVRIWTSADGSREDRAVLADGGLQLESPSGEVRLVDRRVAQVRTADGLWKYVALGSGRSFTSPIELADRDVDLVVTHTDRGEDVQDTLGRLERLLEASVASGDAVCWFES